MGAAEPDPLVYEEKDHSYYMGVRKSRSEKFLFIDLQSTQQSEVRYADAADPKLSSGRCCRAKRTSSTTSIIWVQNFIIRTNWQAPNFRIVRAPIATSADKQTWVNVIAATNDTFIAGFRGLQRLSGHQRALGRPAQDAGKAWGPGKDTLIASEEPSYAATLVHTPGLKNSTVRYVFSSLEDPAHHL